MSDIRMIVGVAFIYHKPGSPLELFANKIDYFNCGSTTDNIGFVAMFYINLFTQSDMPCRKCMVI